MDGEPPADSTEGARRLTGPNDQMQQHFLSDIELAGL